MSEKVLVFPKNKFNFANWDERKVWKGRESDSIVKSILNSEALFYMSRDEAETNEDFAQIIPYSLLVYDMMYFQYQRTKKGGEARLHDKWSIGIGGHINQDDADKSDTMQDTYVKAFYRELKEEVDIVGGFTNNIVGLIYDGTDEVGRVHFGIVHSLDVEGLADLRANDAALTNGGFLPFHKIHREKDRFENWSQMVIEHLI